MKIFENTKIAFQSKNNYELRRAHLLFEAVNIPALVNFSEWVLPFAKHIPGVKTLIKKSIFAHFCGGETRKESLETVEKLHEKKIGSILDYSIEGKEEESAYDNCFQEINEIIFLAKDNPAIPFVVFKPTGYGSIHVYEKVGLKEKLTEKEQIAWENIQKRYFETCKNAYENDVLLMIDAEESWMQDAVDELVTEMMKIFNRERCIIINTLQMYRHDRLEFLKNQYEEAERENYFLGYKVVRGAYMEKERERALEKGYPSPIQPDKQSTDNDYNAAIDFIFHHQDRILLFAGTHNELSCFQLKEKLEKSENPKTQQVWFGQLLGMSDNISYVLADLNFHVAKYVPYGPVNDVLPYLIRRAKENTSVAGQSGRELILIEKELKRRKQENP
ncbi:Bifunctional proline dehydrogenase/pyrroline-5-carboxylate dehydrogenase [Candidatus Ornithobacterium hominis]|uniref:proline dehydrogenase family protein n=1 Tax=Candidatus Ornithobacterium hominis TaxID=2497989 RepID=UPI0024BD41AD|nr:proline dehydrogenase family protein [Candidatus Ornithobacterium hominis]CAI9430005.1 Bifunctional proline dehydrogenase/pyrroline-5-carboxylate dehydrogenase [Candidatus Ornithobacterium hominis]